MPLKTRRESKARERAANILSRTRPPAHFEELQFRHGHWCDRRQLVYAALERTGAGLFQLNRFSECGGECTVEWSEKLERYRLRANYCHSRHCEPCMKAKADLIARNLRDAMEGAKPNQYRFITLTLRHTDEQLNDQVRRLYRSFKKMRSMPAWKSSQDGGAYMLEIKHNGRHWHPHIHVISAGRFLNKFDLSAMWKEATGDSSIVDIRALAEPRDCVHYVCKYVTKGTNQAVWHNPELAIEFIIATKGIRACGTFGAWRGFRLLARNAQATDWKPVASLVSLWNRARGGDQVASDILRSLRLTDQELEME